MQWEQRHGGAADERITDMQVAGITASTSTGTSTSTSSEVAALRRQLVVDQRVQAEHVREKADQATLAADAAKVAADQLAITTAQAGGVDVVV